MEGETVTLQEIFEYKYDKDNVAQPGGLVYTGLRPTCGKFERNGVELPPFMRQHSFSNGEREGMAAMPMSAAPAASAFAARPNRIERPTRPTGRIGR